MKNKIFSLVLILIFVLSCSIGVLSADITPKPDVIYTASQLIGGETWIKAGAASSVGEGDNTAYRYVPNNTGGNGFGFVVDVPVEKANYVVIRQYTNLNANTFCLIYSHDSSFDFTKQYGSIRQDYALEDRVLTINVSALAAKVKGAGENSVKYLKLTPWEGQKWEVEEGKSTSDYFYHLYSVAFFANEKDANAYAKALEESLPDVSEDEKLNVAPSPEQTVTPSAPKVDTTVIDKMVNDFKSKRVDNPFIKGYDNGTTFKPDGNMTRAEACTIIMRLLTAEEGIKGKYTTKFSDVKAGAWYYDAIAYLETKGYLNSYTGTFKPDQKITRAEFVELVYKTVKKADKDSVVLVCGSLYLASDIKNLQK